MKLRWILAMSVAAACVDQTEDVSNGQQAVTSGNSETPIGEQDVPDPGTEPLGPDAEGPPVAGPPVDPALLAAQHAYISVLLLQEVQWELAGLTDDARNAARAELKSAFLGEWL